MSLYTRGRTRRSLIDTVVLRAASQIATVLGYVVMVRGMSKQDFGTFSLLYAFIPVISTIASLGLEQTLRRFQPEYLKAGNISAASWLVRFVASTRFCTNIILLCIVLLCWNVAAPLFKLGAYRAEFMMFCLLILLFFQVRILQLALAGQMMHRFSVGSIAAIALVKLIGYGVMAWQHALTLQVAIVIETAAYGFAYALLIMLYRRHRNREASGDKYIPDSVERRRLLRYGIYNNFNDAGTLVLTTKSDNFFIAAIFDPVSVGIYSFYTRLNLMLSHLLPMNLFENVVQPVFFSVRNDEADRKVPQYFSLLLNLNLVMQWPILAYATAYHAEIVEVVFGAKYIEHSWLLPLMAFFTTLNVVGSPATLVAQQEEKAGIILLSKVFAIYNVVALLVLLPLIGLFGATIASGSAQLMKNAFIWWHVRKRARWTNAGAALLAGFALWAGVIAACRQLGAALHGLPIVSLGVGAVIVAAAGVLHIRGPAVSADDRRILSRVFHGREAEWLRRIGLLRAMRTESGSGASR